MGKRMKNAPVYYMVAQIKFNPVLSLEEYITVIQEKFRNAGFPDFKRNNVTNLNFPGKNEKGEPLAPIQTTQTRYIFNNIIGNSGFVLGNDALAYQTTDYKTFEDFINEYIHGLKIVHESLKLNYTERIGIRYLDAVQPNEGETLSDYLIAEVLGLSQQISEKELIHTFSETVAKLPIGQLVTRIIIRKGEIGLSQDIAMMAPIINQKFKKSKRIHAILDTDAFSLERKEFVIDNISKKLDSLHEEIYKSFKAVTTKHAQTVWK